MSARDDKIAALVALTALGKKVDYCEYIAVDWVGDGSVMRYYGHAPYSRVPPFTRVKRYTGGDHIDKRILAQGDPFRQFELQPDIRTQDIAFEFDDIDKAVSDLFRDHGTARMRMYHYFPQVDLNEEVWMGQLHPPQITGRKTLKTVASNNRRAREVKVPAEGHQFFCPATFGRRFTALIAQQTGLCPVNDHLPGGTIGAGDATDCSRLDEATCNANTGATDGRYFGGYNVRPVTYSPDPHHGVTTTSKGNRSLFDQQKRWLAGRKHMNACTLLFFAREPNTHLEQGIVHSVWEIGIGPFQSITNVRVNSIAPNFNQWAVALGNLGQGRIGDGTLLQVNLSGTGLFIARVVVGNQALPAIDAQSLHGECDALGYNKVAVFTDDDPLTYSRIYTDDRVWWLLEVHTNQRAGNGQDPSEFWIGDLITESAHNRANVVFTRTVPEPGGTGTIEVTYPHRRTTFNHLFEGRPFDETVVDICRSGRITPPYLYQGKYTISSFRAYTGGELAAAPVFTDVGPANNIQWIDGLPNIQFSEIDDDKLPNKIKLSFEEFSNKGLSRPIELDDKDQQLRAGRAKGIDNFWEVTAEYVANGVDELNEAVKLGFSHLWFGQFNEGGIYNNWRGVFYIPYVQALALRRYQAIKIVSDLNDKLTPDGDPFEYFQVLYMRKVNANLVELTVQGYNQQKAEAFETSGGGGGGGDGAMLTYGAGSNVCNGYWPRMGLRNLLPWFQKGDLIHEAIWSVPFSYFRYQMWNPTTSVIYYLADGPAAEPWDTTYSVQDGFEPAPTVEEHITPSPEPAEVPLTPPVDKDITVGTITQGPDTVTIPLS